MRVVEKGRGETLGTFTYSGRREDSVPDERQAQTHYIRFLPAGGRH